MREVSFKNYLILGFISVLVVGFTLLLMSLYNSYHIKVYNSDIKKYLSEIKYEDLENFIIEKPNMMIYVNDSGYNNDDVEKVVKEIIIEYNLQQSIVYVEKNKAIKKEYNLDGNNPVFIMYKNGKVDSVLSKKKYSKDLILEFMKENDVIEND